MESTQLFKALSDPTRLRCLMLLANQGELCVCELTHALGLPQPKISHHLAALRKVQLVTDRKAGLWSYYQLHSELPKWVLEVVRTTSDGLRNEEPFIHDATALAKMPNRPGGICSA